jgi:predicted ribosome quality control (RQC) complex YloA/Tae2 family protein
MSFTSSDGLEILVGRSNAMNDELTFKTARRTDYVAPRAENTRQPRDNPLRGPGAAGAYDRGGRGPRRVLFSVQRADAPLWTTPWRNVKKPSGAMPGFVIYTDYKTIVAEGSEELEARLKK